jgi:hypothetical protein
VVGNTTINGTSMPLHGHGANYLLSYGGGVGLWNVPTGAEILIYYGVGPSDAGGSGPHNHPVTMGIQYIDLILASKN